MNRNGRTMRRGGALVGAIVATAGLGTADSRAATYTWVGGHSLPPFMWNDKQNWNPADNNKPAGGDTALFLNIGAGSGLNTPTVSSGDTVGVLTFNSTTSSYNITGGSGVSLAMSNTGSAAINLLSTNTANQTISVGLSLASDLSIANNSSGTLTISGAITGTTRSLTKSGSGTVVLTASNSYTGGTTVSGGTLSLDTTGGLASTGNLTINGGTFQINTIQQAVNQFSMSSGGLSLSLNGNTAAGRITASGGTVTGGTLALSTTGSQTLGRYTLVSGLSGTASGYTASGVPTDYRVLSVGSGIDLVHKATIGTITVNPVADVIVGGSTTVSGTVANSAVANSSDLAFGVSGSSAAGTFGAAANGTATAGSSGSFGGLTFTGTTVGAGQAATLSVADPNATNSAQTKAITVNVRGHATPTFTNDTINGTVNVIQGTSVSKSVTLKNGTAGDYIAGLSIDAVNMLTRSGSGVIAAGGSETLTANLNTAALGSSTQSFSVSMFDDHAYDGKGAATAGTQAFSTTVNVYQHADAQFVTGTFAASYDPAHTPPYSNGAGDVNYTPVEPSQTLSDGNHTLNIDFGTIWATPYDNPYPVYAYFDITNPLSFAVTVAMSGLTGGATVTPAGTSPTWALQAADGGAFDVTSLAAGGVYHARVLFNTNDPGLYLPGSPFKAAWDISLLEDQTVAGAYTTARVLHVNATAVAVPLPASSLAGVGLLGGLGMMRIARSRRSKAEQLV